MRTIILATALVLTGVPAAANPQAPDPAKTTPGALKETAIQVRSEHAPGLPKVPDNCPFRAPNILLGAYLWSYSANGSGTVVNQSVRRVGTAKVCGVITDPTFTPGSIVSLYGEFSLDKGRTVVKGECVVAAKNTPAQGVQLAGCGLNILSGPPGFVGGIATSSSVFNPGEVPGFGTGSYWTFRTWTNA